VFTKVAIICGGRSSEHEISCISANGVLQAIDRNLFDIELIGITKSGKWLHLPKDSNFMVVNGVLPIIPENGVEVSITSQGLIAGGKNLAIDVVFPVLHGPYGEDGTIQGLLEIIGLRYVGSGVLASAVCMDKSYAKPIFAAAGGAVEHALTFDSKVIIEQAVVGKEIECAVLESDEKLTVSAVGEIAISKEFEFYDFQAKYLDNSMKLLVPANLPKGVEDQIKKAALIAFSAAGCEGLARIDFFYSNTGEVIINEINTMPGFTPTSVYPKLIEESGVDYQLLITKLIKTAMNRSISITR